MGNSSHSTLTSVDNALRVLELLSEKPSLRVIEVAEHLGVARSTAHRVLVALMARGFLVQDAHKIYRAGPAIDRFRRGRLTGPRATRELVHPHLERLTAEVGETAHVAILEGSSTRFVDSVESPQPLRVGSRTGMLLPADRTAIGLVLLAELPTATLRAIYPRGTTGDSRDAKASLLDLERKIRSARRHGYAVNMGQSDSGISAVGTCLRDSAGRAFAGIALAVPTPRFDSYDLAQLHGALTRTAAAIRNDLEATAPGDASPLPA